MGFFSQIKNKLSQVTNLLSNYIPKPVMAFASMGSYDSNTAVLDIPAPHVTLIPRTPEIIKIIKSDFTVEHKVKKLYNYILSDDQNWNSWELENVLLKLETLTNSNKDNKELRRDMITLESVIRTRMEYASGNSQLKFSEYLDTTVRSAGSLPGTSNQVVISEQGTFHVSSLGKYHLPIDTSKTREIGRYRN